MPLYALHDVTPTLDERAIELLRWSSAHYVENGRRFLNDFRPA
jgi:hypothetical protein